MRKEFIEMLKTLQKKVGETPVMNTSDWLALAQELQRRIHDVFRITQCEVCTRYTDVFSGKAIDIAVCRKNSSGDDFSLFETVTLYGEQGIFAYQWKCQRDWFNKFCNNLIKEI